MTLSFKLTNRPEAYAVPDKKAQTVAGLLLTELIPRFGTPLELVSDNWHRKRQ